MTAAERAWIERRLGQYACQFTGAQLDNLFADAKLEGAINPLFGTIALAYYQLMTGAVTLTNFRQGETQEWESVIFDRLHALYIDWYNRAGFPTPLPVFDVKTMRLFYIDFPEEVENA